MKMIFYSRANKTHFYKIGFALTFCKFVYKVKVFGIWIWPTCSAKVVRKKKYRSALGNAQLLTSNSPNYTVHSTLLYATILRTYAGFAVAFGSTFTRCRGLVQLAYLHISFHHTTVECQRHPLLGVSRGMQHARPRRFSKLF